MLVLHADMDAFFAAVEIRDNPDLAGRPVVIGADPESGRGRGVVSTASYEARKYGIRSAMPISEAWRRNPEAVFLRPSMEKYAAASREVFDIFAMFSPSVEKVSIDEAFLDIDGMENFYKTPEILAAALKAKVKSETGLTVSAGIASSKFIAKIASDFNKPDGLTVVAKGREQEFISDMEIEKMWGVGKKASAYLKKFGIYKIRDIRNAGEEKMISLMKQNGKKLYLLSQGIDFRKVTPHTGRKSISEEHTFHSDQDDDDAVRRSLLKTCEILAGRMRKEKLKGKTVTLKIRLEGFETFTRSRTLAGFISGTGDLYREASSLYDSFDRKNKPVRLIGAGVSGLNINQKEIQYDLFSDSEAAGREEIIEKTVGDLNDRFGKKIRRAVFLNNGL